jgi:hypothetical protein
LNAPTATGTPTDSPPHGARIEIAKGTTVYESGWHVPEGIVTGRRTTGTVVTVHDLASDHGWQRFVTKDEQETLVTAAGAAGCRIRWPWREAWADGLPIFDAVRARIFAMFDGDLRFVSWGERMAHVSDVRIVEAKRPKERSITLRTLMTPGSVWRTTRDLRLTGLVATVDLERKRYAKLPPISVEEGGMTRIALTDVPAGTEFTVHPDKKHYAMGRGNGTAVAITADVADFDWYVAEPHSFFQNPLEWNGMHLPLKQIEGAVELVEAATSTAFVLRDGETGLLFGGFTEDWAKRETHLRMVQTFSSARKYATVANAKASIVAWTGRNPRWDLSDGERPEWVGWDKVIDLPPTWVLVEIDRVTLAERPSIDIQEWHRSLPTS